MVRFDGTPATAMPSAASCAAARALLQYCRGIAFHFADSRLYDAARIRDVQLGQFAEASWYQARWLATVMRL